MPQSRHITGLYLSHTRQVKTGPKDTDWSPEWVLLPWGFVTQAATPDEAVAAFWDVFYSTQDRHRPLFSLWLDGQPHPGFGRLSRDPED